MDQLRIYFHFRSPYSRLGLHVLARSGVADTVETKLLPFTRMTKGATFANPTENRPKLRYIMEDAPRMALRAGLPVAMPKPMDPDYRPSLEAFHHARAQGAALPFAIAVSDARWGLGADISEPKLLNQLLADSGVQQDNDPGLSYKSEIEADEAMIDSDKVFGVPFAVLERGGTKQSLWGHDRFELLVEMLP